jgi:3-dehydroquinate synthase
MEPTLLAEGVLGDSALIVTNETVAPLYLDHVRHSLGSSVRVASCVLPDGERYKTLDTLSRIHDAAIDNGCDRATTVIAVGGGVIGDLAGFAAATYQRGVNLVQVPTTLLAQVDASVGGKTGVNHPRGKNMIGAFHQPRSVLADTDVLASLPEREFNAGLAEVIKYGLLGDAAFFDWLERHVDTIRRRDRRRLTEAIERSCANKAAIVAGDELERANRALLNLGHTFGHAIEAAVDYTDWLHGEAVAVGMRMAAQLSADLGMIGHDAFQRVIDLLERAGLPIEPPTVGGSRLKRLMMGDKKNLGGQLRLVLLDDIGAARVVGGVDEARLAAILALADRVTPAED